MRRLILLLFLQCLLFRCGVAIFFALDSDIDESTVDTDEGDYYSSSGDKIYDDDDTDDDVPTIFNNSVKLKYNKLASDHHHVKPKTNNSSWRSYEGSDEDQDSYSYSGKYSSDGNRYNSRGRDSYENSRKYNHRRDRYDGGIGSGRVMSRRYGNDDDHNGRHTWHSKRQQIRIAPVLMPSGFIRNITIPTDSNSRILRTKLYLLKPDGKRGKVDYAIVKSEMESTWSPIFSGKIVKIEKVVNSGLWNRYRYRKCQVTTDVKVSNEVMLFFGADASTIMEVTKKGFDERNLTLESTPFGAGYLLTEHSDQSNGYTSVQSDGNRLMLLCRVTLGSTKALTTATPMAHPPVDFLSVKGSLNGQSVYVVYRREQIYPEYLITYI